MSHVFNGVSGKLQNFYSSTRQMDSVVSHYNDQETLIHVHAFDEVVSNQIRITNTFFEVDFLDYVKSWYPYQTEIVDIGANIGNHSLFFAEFLHCDKIHSFEPVALNVDILRKNMQRHGDKSIIYDMALSNCSGQMPLYNSQYGNYGGFSLHSYSNGSSSLVGMEIPVATLDSFGFQNISMIKIDVENHENEVLEGAMQTIRQNKPILFIENLYYEYPHVCPNPDPHAPILHDLGYEKKDSNICHSLMDLWIPKRL